jgi:hypothetical protein
MTDVARVERPVAQARATCDRVAAIYDLAENPFEHRARRCGLRLLAAHPVNECWRSAPERATPWSPLPAAWARRGR